MKAITRGPVKVIESHGIRIPIYHAPTPSGQPGFLLAYYVEGKRKQERAKTLSEAEQHAKAKIKELTTGAAHVGSFSPRETAVIAEAVSIAQRCNISMVEALREYEEARKILDGTGGLVDAAKSFVRDHARNKIPTILFSEVVEKFYERNEKLRLSDEHRSTCKKHLTILSKSLGRTQIGNIQQTDISAALDVATGRNSERRFNNLRGTINALFSYAQREGFLPRDKKHEASLVEKRNDRIGGQIAIYTPAELEIILGRIEDGMIPWIVLSGLAGLRTSEVHRLTWEMVRFDAAVIVLDKGFTKTKRRRVIPMCDALVEWLKPVAGTGRLYDFSLVHFENLMRKAWAGITESDGRILVEKKMNGLRHSYGSYRFALLQDENKVSAEMGNSPSELREHYAELALPGDAKKWFNITSVTVTKKRRKYAKS